MAAAHGLSGTGLTPGDLLHVMPFKARVFFLEKDSANLWYGGIGAVQGVLQKFDLSQVYAPGGNCVAMGTMTMDAGDGIDDMAVFLMEDGGVLVYQGIDIGTDGLWYLRGIYHIGAVVGDRPLVRWGADLIAITTDGYVQLGPFITGGRGRDQSAPLSDAIQGAVSDAVRLYGAQFGWQAILHAPANWLLFNVGAGSSTVQHVLNTQTGAWCRFTGIEAYCWGKHDDRLYFGGTAGKVYLADNGGADMNLPIEGDVQSAYRYFGGSEDNWFRQMRAHVESTGDVTFQLGAAVDFEPEAPLEVTSSVVVGGSTWANVTWADWIWAPPVMRHREWQDLSKEEASAISVRLRSSTRGARVTLFATDILYEKTRGVL